MQQNIFLTDGIIRMTLKIIIDVHQQNLQFMVHHKIGVNKKGKIVVGSAAEYPGATLRRIFRTGDTRIRRTFARYSVWRRGCKN